MLGNTSLIPGEFISQSLILCHRRHAFYDVCLFSVVSLSVFELSEFNKFIVIW